MLNGKFFTGLPPKMIDKNSTARNRMESHFFWPDDSMAESAVDTRIKRRNSVQGADRAVYEKQNSVEANDVDTRKRFSKEFSQSSIQFCDNLNDNNSTNRRRSQLQSRAGMKRSELAEKPTATKLQLPESVVDEAYTSAKKKQAYTSKIQFYDFVNEEDNAHNSRSNNLRKPKMDMNDKREMELNSKNSPKLQMKRDVRSLSEEKELPKMNNREVKTLERSSHIKEVNVNRSPPKDDDYAQEDTYNRRSNTSPKRNLANKNNSGSAQRGMYRVTERNNGRDEVYRYAKEPKGNIIKTEPRYTNERREYQKSNNSVLTRNDYENFNREPQVFENRKHSSLIDENHEDSVEYPKYKSVRNDTKRYNNRSQYDYQNNRKDINDYEEEIGTRMKAVRIQQSPPRKHHQNYREEGEPYEQVEEYPRYSRNRSSVTDQSRRGNAQRRSDYNHNERYEADVTYVEEDKPINNGRANFNRVNNKLNNENHTGWDDYSPSQSSFRNSAPTNSSRSVTANTSSASMEGNNNMKKHLRSSLCFHDGAIIAENDATQSPTSTQASSIQRRNARSSAATKRVSVGLPD